jgi:dihydroxyacetone kinase-like predicted kinase
MEKDQYWTFVIKDEKAQVETDKYFCFNTDIIQNETDLIQKLKELIDKCIQSKVIIIYSGLNKNSNNEDMELKKRVKKKYSMIKVSLDSIENVDKFIDGEVK